MTDGTGSGSNQDRRDRLADALAGGGLIDITTTGRKSGRPHRIELTFLNLGGHVYISGMPGPRDWYANILADPHFTFHLKRGIEADLPALGRPIDEETERRSVLDRITRVWKRHDDIDAFVQSSPLVEVEFEPTATGGAAA